MNVMTPLALVLLLSACAPAATPTDPPVTRPVCPVPVGCPGDTNIAPPGGR